MALPRPELVVVACSTGGPQALGRLLAALPQGFSLPILVVQHALPGTERLLADQLARRAPGLRVEVARDGREVEGGVLLLAVADQHLEVEGRHGTRRVRLTRGPKENSVRPASDVLFRSAARACGPRTLGIVLTGLGFDGREGARALRQAGGRVWAQDAASAQVASMPVSVAEARLAEWVATPEELGRSLGRLDQGATRWWKDVPVPDAPLPGTRSATPARAQMNRATLHRAGSPGAGFGPGGSGKGPSASPSSGGRTDRPRRPGRSTCTPASFAFVRELLRERAGISLPENKETFVCSRLVPVAEEAGLPDVDALVGRLLLDPFGPLHVTTLEALMVGETSFFRDAPAFDVLLERVLPPVVERRRTARDFRVWSAACSTGEEPYSVAMMLPRRFPELEQWAFGVTATDLSRRSIARASAGVYSDRQIERGLPPTFRERNFVRTAGGWQASEELRRRITFQQLNLKQGYPFGVQFDLVLMRNVLIYFDDDTKRDVLVRVAATMRPGAVLVLGNADSLRWPVGGLKPLRCEPLVAYERG